MDFELRSGASGLRRITLLGLVLFWLPLVLMAGGCASTGASEEQPALVLTSTLDQSIYRPGEAIVVQVRIQNTSDDPMVVRVPDASSIQIAYNKVGDDETPVLRQPIHSPSATLGGMMQLPAGGSFDQKYAFTRLTYYQGAMKAQIQYDPNAPGTFTAGPTVYGNTMHFDVGGEKMFDRDAAGLITQDEAIRLARERVNGNVADTAAIVVQDQRTGMYVTWVNLTVVPPNGDLTRETVVSYMVDPYMGKVLAQARPFNPQAAQDPRFRRPANLPNRPAPGNNTGAQAPAPAPAAPPAQAPAAAAPAAAPTAAPAPVPAPAPGGGAR